MTIKRIIPCLDFRGDKVVKGVKFQNLKEIGDPRDLAVKYDQEGADELIFLDISASNAERKMAFSYIKTIAEKISIPLTVGGGIESLEDMEKVFALGASKVSINTAAINNPGLINSAKERFGKERLVVAIDAAKVEETGSWCVFSGGKPLLDLDLFEWAKEVEKRGAGEILITSKDNDGEKNGYDLELLSRLKKEVAIPLIASGGAGKKEHLKDGLLAGADAVLAASIFHYNQVTVKECKEYLLEEGFKVSGKGLLPQFNQDGLVAATSVDKRDGTVLMQAFMNKEAFEKTLETKKATFYSRSRKKLWVKGEESGNFQDVHNVLLDCDRDSVLLVVTPKGPSCHTGQRSCFYTSFFANPPHIGETLFNLTGTIQKRRAEPIEGSYTNYLFDQGLDKILKKVGEEAAEVIIAAKNTANGKDELIYEVSDLIYHLSVLLEESDLKWEDIALELERRVK